MHEAALDTSGGTAFAIKENDKVIATHYRPFEPQNTQENLEPWLRDSLQEHELTFSSVARWFVGVGPGSFTGIRVGIAFVKGLALQSAAEIQGISTAYAVAAQSSADLTKNSRIIVLNDARRHQLVLTEFHKEKGGLSLSENSFIPADEEQLKHHLSNCSRLVTMQPEAVNKVLPEEFRGKLLVLNELDASSLFSAPEELRQRYEMGSTNIEPIYVRPPAAVKPGTGKKS